MTLLIVNMSARKVFITLVATVFCGYLSNVLLTEAVLFELGILVNRNFHAVVRYF